MNKVDFKIVFLGSASVGKTSLIHQYCNGEFSVDIKETVGAGFFNHSVTIGDCDITLFLWDTAGQERFRSVIPSLLRGADGLVLVYDITDNHPFEDLTYYLEAFLDTVKVDMSHQLPVVVLGNKCDCGESQVPKAEMEAWCNEKRIAQHALVSAKTGENVNEVMEQFIKSLISPVRSTGPPTVRLVAEPVNEKKGCC